MAVPLPDPDQPQDSPDSPDSSGAPAADSEIRGDVREPVGCAAWSVTPFILLFGLGGALLIAPLEVIGETWDMLRMRAQTKGSIISTGASTGTEPEAGQAALPFFAHPGITYSYTVDGRDYTSGRYLPGWISNLSPWTRGRRLAQKFHMGQSVDVYYNPHDPREAVLAYAWFGGAVSFFLLSWGFLLYLAAAAFSERGRRTTGPLMELLGKSMMFYGAGSMLLAPAIIPLEDIIWHLGAFAGVVFMVKIYGGSRMKPEETSDERK